jgi:hypothetical protein
MSLSKSAYARILVYGAILFFAAYILLDFGGRAPERAVADAWNDGIARLGIKPLYPPQEDFHVGDVWAMPVALTSKDVPILAAGVRIAHIDLTAGIKAEHQAKPIFDQTNAASTDGYRPQARLALISPPDESGLPLSLAAFPTITLNNGERATAGIDGKADASRDSSSADRIRIKSVETYGAPYLNSLLALEDFCTRGTKTALCKDELIRKAISYSEKEITRRKCDGTYEYPLQIMLVTRVFLTREIDRLNSYGRARTADAKLGASDEQDEPLDAAPAEPALGSVDKNPPAIKQEKGALVRRQGNGIGWSFDQSFSVGMDNQIFQRPLAFGYRGIAFAIPMEKKPPWIERIRSCASSYVSWLQ